MSDFELKPIDFMTVGTVGPRGQRVFYIQAAKERNLVSLIVEKIQVGALADAIDEMLEEVKSQHPDLEIEDDRNIDLGNYNFELRDPIQPEFRVAQLGLGYDELEQMVILVMQELMATDDPLDNPRTARFWAPPAFFKALALHARMVVERGRPDPQRNGRIHYYWT